MTVELAEHVKNCRLCFLLGDGTPVLCSEALAMQRAAQPEKEKR